MDNREVQLKGFFNQYAERFNQALKGEISDSEKTAACFSDCFIEASPVGVSCGKNDESFRAAIPQGYSFYKSIGIRSVSRDGKSSLEVFFYQERLDRWKY